MPTHDNACHHLLVPMFISIFFMIWAVSLVVWIWALVDAIRVPEDRFYRAGTKLIWVLVIVLTQVIGAIIYLAIGRPDPSIRSALKLHGPPPLAVPPPPLGSIPPAGP